MSDWFRDNDDPSEVVEIRYLHIPDLPPGEIDEIVYRGLHLETLDFDSAYITVAGLMVRIAVIARRGQQPARLSITCEPHSCTLIEEPPK